MSEEETKKYHRKKLYELSVKSLGQIALLDEPTDEQKHWVLFRLAHPETWQRWFIGLYFIEEQKLQIGLTDKDIAGERMA